MKNATASGVAISCSDSNTASNGDASEPASPYSAFSILGEEEQQNTVALIMPPQTILASSATSAAASSTNSNSSNSSTTISVNSNATNVGIANSNNDTNTAKTKQSLSTKQMKASNSSSPRSTIPSLQWPWSGSGTQSSIIHNAAQGQNNVTPGNNTTTGNIQTVKKRNSSGANEGSGGKKSRVSHSNSQDSNILANSTNTNIGASKRLKAAALEESQTKITGYFKSQMKAQIHQGLNSKRSSEVVSPIPTSTSSTTSGMSSTSFAKPTPNRAASINKYISIMNQIIENESEYQGKCSSASNSSNSNNNTNVSTSNLACLAPLTTQKVHTPPNLSITNSSKSVNLQATTMPVPALKKIERSKPTKIAQVAPNLRKTPANQHYSMPVKSPKKPVAIAPRTPEIKQQQMQQKAEAVSNKIHLQQQQNQHVQQQQPTQPNQPAVLLTAIRLPPQHNSSQLKSPQTATKIAHTTAVTVPNNTNTIVTPNNSTLYQLPAVQIPNLVQLPQLLAPNGTNLVQLQNMAAAAAAAKTVATTATTAAASTAQAAAQYILNGTVFKLQQFTTATTTTASAVSAAATASNPFNLLTGNDMQDMLLKQHQHQMQQQHKVSSSAATTTSTTFQEFVQQQIAAAIANQQQQQQLQHLQRLAAANIQQSPVFMATPAGVLLNAASIPAMLAQAAAIAANNQQQQKNLQLASQTPTQIPALQPIQTNGIPALSPIFAPNPQQQQNQQDQHDLQQQQYQAQQLAQIALAQTQQHQFLTATQPPPLSAVTVTSTNNVNNTATSSSNNCSITATSNALQTTAKLSIVKATNSATNQYPISSTQPPPLVTISTPKTRTAPTPVAPKPAALTKPYQKRQTKVLSQPKPITSSKGKITACGKIIATSTTPPPLVPASPSSLASSVKDLPPIRTATSTSIATKSILPTPALVSISSPTIPSLKLTQSLASISTPITKSNPLPILPSPLPCTMTISSNINPPPIKSISTPSTPDLFDLVKNSNGAISITPASNCINSNTLLSNPLSNNSFSCTISKYTPPMISCFSKIKDEPLDDLIAYTTSSSMISANTDSKDEILEHKTIKLLPEDVIKCELEDSLDIVKDELASNIQNECSSSSFSSSSNSVSSAADLSLDASTPASMSSASNFGNCVPSPVPSMNNSMSSLLPTNNSHQISANYDSNSSSPDLCISASLEATRASSQDILSELATSASSDCSNSSNDSTDSKALKMDEDRDSMDSPDEEKRDLPSPESGIGGSLTNSDCGNSEASEGMNEIGKIETDSNTSNDENSPPPTPSQGDVDSNSNDSSPSPSCPNEDSSTSNESLMPSPSLNIPIISTSESSNSLSDLSSSTPTIDTQIAEVSPKCAISPILSQPKTIRFPAESGYGSKGGKRHDGVCYWDNCNKKHESNSKLLDHMQSHHVNSQSGPFTCLWVGCKVYNKKSCSRRWLERHVLSHGGSKQFKCIVEGCGLRFGSQLALQKHVNNHFNAADNKEQTSKRTSDPPVPKQLRKNGKKLRYRRQPFSARMFDFFDGGIMEGLQHRLRQISTLTNGSNSITFQGYSTMRRKTVSGKYECFVKWTPHEIISDEWLPESNEPFVKTLNIKQMKPSEKTKVESLLKSAYKLPYSPNLFENNYSLSASYCNNNNNNESEDDEVDDDDTDDTDGDSDDSEDDGESITETISSYEQVLTIASIEERRKHPRKPQKHKIAPTIN